MDVNEKSTYSNLLKLSSFFFLFSYFFGVKDEQQQLNSHETMKEKKEKNIHSFHEWKTTLRTTHICTLV